MASGVGTAQVDFGAGATLANVAVTGQVSFGALSLAEAYFMGDDTTTDHTTTEHRAAASIIGLVCGSLVAGVGFTIYASSLTTRTGKYSVRWVWSDPGGTANTIGSGFNQFLLPGM